MADELLAVPPSTPVLVDEGRVRRVIPLDRVLERQRYPPLLTAVLVLILAFVAFQVVGAFATIFGLLATGLPPADLLNEIANLATARPGLALFGNTVGQVLGIAVPALLIARMHSSRWAPFLRLTKTDAAAVGLGLVGLVAVTPFVQWLGSVNELLPLPEWLQALEDVQDQLIQQVLSQMRNVGVNLLMLAVTPALCEELLFRGYVLRQGERSLGVVGGILFSGIVFGLYHLRLTQLLPLATLGLYMAWLTWRTGSLWPAIAVHFANNGFAVAASAYVSSRPDLGTEALEQIDVPWYYIVLGLAVLAAVARLLNRRHGAPAARAVDLVHAPEGERQPKV